MLEFIVGAAVGALASGTGGGNSAPQVSSDRGLAEATKEVAKATREGANNIADSLQGLGQRETVCWVETLQVDRAGRVLSAAEVRRICERILEDNPMLRALEPERGVELAEEKLRQLIQPFDVHHFWSVVVGHESRRTAYRTLPDGMARFVHRDPDTWKERPR